MTHGSFTITEQDIEAFQRDGAVCLRGIFSEWVETIAAGIERNLAEPGTYASRYIDKDDKPGGFFDDYCNWQRIPEFRAMVEESLSQSMIILDNEWWRLFESPISLLFFALTAVSLSWPLIARRKPKSSPPPGTDEAAD